MSVDLQIFSSSSTVKKPKRSRWENKRWNTIFFFKRLGIRNDHTLIGRWKGNSFSDCNGIPQNTLNDVGVYNYKRETEREESEKGSIAQLSLSLSIQQKHKSSKGDCVRLSLAERNSIVKFFQSLLVVFNRWYILHFLTLYRGSIEFWLPQQAEHGKTTTTPTIKTNERTNERMDDISDYRTNDQRVR